MFGELFEQEANGFWARLRRLAERTPRLERLYAREADGRVARLVQSAAFAFAAVRERLDDDDQALVRPLVARAMPECLRPRPASTILELPPSKARSGDIRGTHIDATAGDVDLPFELVWSVNPRPLELNDVRLDRLHARLQVLRLSFVAREGTTLATVLGESVRLFVHVDPRRVALDLVHALRTSNDPIRVTSFGPAGRTGAEATLPRSALRWVRIDTDEPPLVSGRADRFRSSTLLRDLFSFPESFCFFDLHLGAIRDPKVTRIEVTLPLAHVVEEGSGIGREHVRLFCGPATNQFLAPITPLRRVDGPVWPLSVGRRPHAEILDVRSIYTEARPSAQRMDILSWESPETPHTFDRDAMYYLLEQSISRTQPHTTTRLSFATLDGFFADAPGAFVEGEVLASDGTLTAALGLGDVGGANITRVTSSQRALLGSNHAWRLNAYARMPSVRFAEPVHFAEFVRLHATPGAEVGSEAIRTPRFAWTDHEREHRLDDSGVLHWGDAFTVGVDTTACSDGEAWLVGAILARALAERNERLRFSRLTLQRGSKSFAAYDTRDGERFPFPLG